VVQSVAGAHRDKNVSICTVMLSCLWSYTSDIAVRRSDLRILFVTAVYPHAAEYGAQQRVLNICRLLRQLGKLSLVIVASKPVDQDSLNRTREEFDVVHVALIQDRPMASLLERIRFECDPDFLNTHYGVIRDSDR
jgi:hypothetical protein